MTTDGDRPDTVDDFLGDLGRVDPPPTLAFDTIQRLRAEPSRGTRGVRPALALVAVLAVAIVAFGAFAVAGPDLTPRPSLSPSPEMSATAESATPPSATPTPTVTASPSPIAVEPPTLAWTRHDLSGMGHDVFTVAKLRDRFLAVGSRPGAAEDERSVLSSTDGVRWKTLVRRAFGADRALSLSVVDDTAIAIAIREGEGGEVSSAPTSAWRSRDGATWDMWIDVGTDRPAPLAFARVGDTWVGVSQFGPIRSSVDGRPWSDTSVGEGAEMSTLAVGPAGVVVSGLTFVEVGDTDVARQSMWQSADGRTWTESLLEDGASAELSVIGADERAYVAIGTVRQGHGPFAPAAWWSVDGRSWHRASIPDDVSPGHRATSIVAYEGGYLAVGIDDEGTDEPEPFDDLAPWWSTDGRAWVKIDDVPKEWLSGSVVVDGDRLLLFGQRGEGDGPVIVWEARPSS